MPITATSATSSASDLSSLASASGSSAASEQRFLKLLVTQLNNQDPLNPLDNAQLTSQLAQMSTVSGIEKLNSAFQSLITQSGSSQVLQSANLIGRSVLVPGHDLNLSKGVSTLFAVDLPNTADSVKVTVSDSSGAVVRSIDLGGLSQGVKSFSWDGKNDGGASLSDGSYSINVIALAGGSQTSANALTYANVISVSQTSTGVSLDIGHGRKAALSDVKQIL